jgi:small subunit ribosomal protein S3
MGHKVHPTGFRLGIIKDWQAKWYDEKNYTELVHEDLAIRKAIQAKYSEAGVSRVEIERGSNEVTVTVHTARPGMVIGRGGQRVDEFRNELQRMTGKKVRLNIQEIREPELDAYLVAKNIAEQLQRRISRRRAVKRTISRTMERGAKGIKVTVSGRIGGAEIARRETEREGSVPLHNLRADIDYGFAEALIPKGLLGVKVWIYKGDVVPTKEVEAEALPEAEVLPEIEVIPEIEAPPEAEAPVE